MTEDKSLETNVWNPFIPTERDLKRTEKLAQKNAWIAGTLTLLFLPLGLIYLNRGVNILKMFGYGVSLAFVVGMSMSSQKEANRFGRGVGSMLSIAATVEQVRTVTLARQRNRNNSDTE